MQVPLGKVAEPIWSCRCRGACLRFPSHLAESTRVRLSAARLCAVSAHPQPVNSPFHLPQSQLMSRVFKKQIGHESREKSVLRHFLY